MTDITKCTGEGCALKETCYRFTATTGMYQSFFFGVPIKNGKCEYYWDINLYHQREMQDQFMRIAMARLRSTYPFKPQRRAVAARMWVKFLERKAMAQWFKDQEANL